MPKNTFLKIFVLALSGSVILFLVSFGIPEFDSRFTLINTIVSIPLLPGILVEQLVLWRGVSFELFASVTILTSALAWSLITVLAMRAKMTMQKNKMKIAE